VIPSDIWIFPNIPPPPPHPPSPPPKGAPPNHPTRCAVNARTGKNRNKIKKIWPRKKLLKLFK